MVLNSCVKDSNFDDPGDSCSESPATTISFQELKSLYLGETVQIVEDLTLEAYVSSSDKAGNFFGTLYLQNTPELPTQGLQLEIDLRESHHFYPIGTKVQIQLKGLYLGKRNAVYRLGGAFLAFGNVSVGRLPANTVSKHIRVVCGPLATLQPIKLNIENITDAYLGILITLDAVEIALEDLGDSFAIPKTETFRTLVDCSGNKIGLLNSGFSEFHSEILPKGNGSISGVLEKDKINYQLIIRDLNDVSFSQDRCTANIQEQTSDQVFISELADPDNNAAARFIELYNAGQEPINLNGWKLKRYTNSNLEAGKEIDLSGLVIKNESTLTITSNASEFEKVYGVSPDFVTGPNGPSDSNGDDNLALFDPFWNANRFIRSNRGGWLRNESRI